MDVADSLSVKLSKYRAEEFYIDEHAYHRCQNHLHIDLEEVLFFLKQRRFDSVEKNDSLNDCLRGFDSFKVFFSKSSNYIYFVVLYLLACRPLIKTVQKLDKPLEENIAV